MSIINTNFSQELVVFPAYNKMILKHVYKMFHVGRQNLTILFKRMSFNSPQEVSFRQVSLTSFFSSQCQQDYTTRSKKYPEYSSPAFWCTSEGEQVFTVAQLWRVARLMQFKIWISPQLMDSFIQPALVALHKQPTKILFFPCISSWDSSV